SFLSVLRFAKQRNEVGHVRRVGGVDLDREVNAEVDTLGVRTNLPEGGALDRNRFALAVARSAGNRGTSGGNALPLLAHDLLDGSHLAKRVDNTSRGEDNRGVKVEGNLVATVSVHAQLKRTGLVRGQHGHALGVHVLRPSALVLGRTGNHEVTRNSAVLVVPGKQLANVSLVVLAGNVGTVKTTLLNDALRVVLHGANNVALSGGTTESRVNVVDVLRLNVNGGSTEGALASALSGTLGNSLAPLLD